jgi:hypothetical protein
MRTPILLVACAAIITTAYCDVDLIPPGHKDLKPLSGDGVTKSGYFCAATEQNLQKGVHLAVQRDQAAFSAMIESGDLAVLPAGLNVFIERYHSGAVLIRMAGKTAEVWTVSEAIQK